MPAALVLLKLDVRSLSRISAAAAPRRQTQMCVMSARPNRSSARGS